MSRVCRHDVSSIPPPSSGPTHHHFLAFYLRFFSSASCAKVTGTPTFPRPRCHFPKTGFLMPSSETFCLSFSTHRFVKRLSDTIFNGQAIELTFNSDANLPPCFLPFLEPFPLTPLSASIYKPAAGCLPRLPFPHSRPSYSIMMRSAPCPTQFCCLPWVVGACASIPLGRVRTMCVTRVPGHANLRNFLSDLEPPSLDLKSSSVTLRRLYCVSKILARP